MHNLKFNGSKTKINKLTNSLLPQKTWLTEKITLYVSKNKN